MTWLVLVDQDRDLSNADTPHKVMSTRDYLSRPQLFGGQKPKIINLSRSYGYQGAGYYCSLLAEARGHRIIPTIETIVIDTGVFPQYGPGVANSMYHEAELFLGSHLTRLQANGILSPGSARVWWEYLRQADDRGTLMISFTAFVIVGDKN